LERSNSRYWIAIAEKRLPLQLRCRAKPAPTKGFKLSSYRISVRTSRRPTDRLSIMPSMCGPMNGIEWLQQYA
jgi:hypothetical protein